MLFAGKRISSSVLGIETRNLPKASNDASTSLLNTVTELFSRVFSIVFVLKRQVHSNEDCEDMSFV